MTTGNLRIKQLALSNFLSYGAEGAPLDLLPLNVLIGPNASGKSNLIEGFSVLRGTAGDLAAVLREGGGIGQYIRRTANGAASFRIYVSLGAEVEGEFARPHDYYQLVVGEANQRPKVARGTDHPEGPRRAITLIAQRYYSSFRGKYSILQHVPGGLPVSGRFAPKTFHSSNPFCRRDEIRTCIRN